MHWYLKVNRIKRVMGVIITIDAALAFIFTLLYFVFPVLGTVTVFFLFSSIILGIILAAIDIIQDILRYH